MPGAWATRAFEIFRVPLPVAAGHIYGSGAWPPCPVRVARPPRSTISKERRHRRGEGDGDGETGRGRGGGAIKYAARGRGGGGRAPRHENREMRSDSYRYLD